MAVTISSKDTKTIQWAIQTKGNALAFLEKKEMNDIVRVSMVLAGKDWGFTFFPKRFGHYVDRAPFPYPSHRLGFYFQKAKRMGIVAGIIQRLSITKGWDPWSTEKPPFALIQEWKKMNPGRYNFRTRFSSSGLIGDMRKNAKSGIFEIIDEMWGDGKFKPLVESGFARDHMQKSITYRATATSNKQVLRITMPIPLRPSQTKEGGGKGVGGISPTVGAVLRTMPHWEVNWFAKRLQGHLGTVLANRHGLSQDARGTVTQRPKTDFQNVTNQRAFSASVGR